MHGKRKEEAANNCLYAITDASKEIYLYGNNKGMCRCCYINMYKNAYLLACMYDYEDWV